MKRQVRAFSAVSLCLLAALTATTGCELGAPVKIDVRSRRMVRFDLADAATGGFCLNSVLIWRGTERRGLPVWEARQDDAASQTTCAARVEFPEAPRGFKVVRHAAELPPGPYIVEMFGGSRSVLEPFDVP